MTKQWIVDDAGTLINMETRETYDYVSELVDELNEQDNERKNLISELHTLRYKLDVAIENGFVLEEDISSKKTRYDSFWETKIKNMEKRQARKND